MTNQKKQKTDSLGAVTWPHSLSDEDHFPGAVPPGGKPHNVVTNFSDLDDNFRNVNPQRFGLFGPISRPSVPQPFSETQPLLDEKLTSASAQQQLSPDEASKPKGGTPSQEVEEKTASVTTTNNQSPTTVTDSPYNIFKLEPDTGITPLMMFAYASDVKGVKARLQSGDNPTEDNLGRNARGFLGQNDVVGTPEEIKEINRILLRAEANEHLKFLAKSLAMVTVVSVIFGGTALGISVLADSESTLKGLHSIGKFLENDITQGADIPAAVVIGGAILLLMALYVIAKLYSATNTAPLSGQEIEAVSSSIKKGIIGFEEEAKKEGKSKSEITDLKSVQSKLQTVVASLYQGERPILEKSEEKVKQSREEDQWVNGIPSLF